MMLLLNNDGYKASINQLISSQFQAQVGFTDPPGVTDALPTASSFQSSRDVNDARGKLPFCLIAKESGISESQLVVDPAQAGGLMGKSDGAFIGPHGHKEPIEIKGSRAKKGKKKTVFIKDIRLNGTDWQHLFIVSREQDPDRWTDVGKYETCGFKLAYVKRKDLIRAAFDSGRGLLTKVDATITPGSKRSWLGRYVRCVKVQDISPDWWNKHVFR